MVPDQIEKEILIDAPVDVVWRVITEPDQIRRWFSDEADLELAKGGQGRLTWTQKSSWPIRVEAVDPLRRFAFRWLQPEGAEPDPSNSTLVEFTLTPEAGSTMLRVVESGFDRIDWADSEKVKTLKEHARGWDEELASLADLIGREAKARTSG